MRQPVDLSAHINQNVFRGGPADFCVSIKPICFRDNGSLNDIPRRFCVVRDDTSEPLAIVSDRYSVVPHTRILDATESALESLDVGPVPRGIYVDRNGARMRALFKFPAFSEPVLGDDDICPCFMIQNTYDGTSRIALQIGAFRFVCSNLAVGGGGLFAGGFMAVHVGEIDVERVIEQLAAYLTEFSAIAALYREWAQRQADAQQISEVLRSLPARPLKSLRETFDRTRVATVYAAYNAATDYATHKMRSARAAFDLLARVNRAFQDTFPLTGA